MSKVRIELQLAKGAIAAGIRILLEQWGEKFEGPHFQDIYVEEMRFPAPEQTMKAAT